MVQRSHTLDAIRGIAILQVVAWHYLVPSLNHHGTVLALLLSGSLNLTCTVVYLFFVLSGFLIGGILMDNRVTPAICSACSMRGACCVFCR